MFVGRKGEKIRRCVNIDWLEVYCLEPAKYYPMDADFFRDRGFFVSEREYGTRVYEQMFTIEDNEGNNWIEVRRQPASGSSSFTGLVPESCHLRLVNRACYDDKAIDKLRDFMLRFEYIFQRIFRIDICYDFEKFDSGDKPDRFARRVLEKRYRKVNQAKLHCIGQDKWNDFEWETLSWGNPKSMVSTKLYLKSLEISRAKADKPYIRYAWMMAGLIDDPRDLTKISADGKSRKVDVWRLEFSMKSTARNWIVIEDVSGKKKKLRRIEHRLELFDSKDKLWQRFEELAFHYFRFKVTQFKSTRKGLAAEALGKVTKNDDRQLERKDRCPDKVLFNFNTNREFYKLEQLPKESKPNFNDQVLRRRLEHYMETHLDPAVRQACETIIDNIGRTDLIRFVEHPDWEEIQIWSKVLQMKMKDPSLDVTLVFEYVRRLISNNEIF